jgi:hypothetical protein
LGGKNIFAEEKAILTNEEFLREGVKSFLEKAWVDFPQIELKEILLYSAEKNPANWLVEQEILSFLIIKGFRVHFRSENFSADSSLPSDFNLSFRIVDLKVTYPKIRGSGIFKKREVQREEKISLYLQLTQMKDNSVLWLKQGEEIMSDWLKKSQLSQVGNENYSFLNPPAPSGFKEKILEPALITAIAGGLVYLFFANR